MHCRPSKNPKTLVEMPNKSHCKEPKPVFFDANTDYYRSIVDTSLDGFWAVNHQGRLLDVNKTYCIQSGYSREELLDMSICDLSTRKPALINAIIQSISANGGSRFESSHRRKDGSIWQVEISASTPHFNSGETYFFAFLRDITQQKHTDTELRIAAAAFQAQECIMVANADSTIVHVNQAFTENTGYTNEELQGRTPPFFTSEPYNAALYRSIIKSIKRTGRWQGEINDQRKNGEIYPKRLTITAVSDADGVTSHYVSVHTDISRQKHTEMRLKHSEALFRQMADCSPVLIWTTDTKEIITFANRAFLGFLGVKTVDELLTMQWREMICLHCAGCKIAHDHHDCSAQCRENQDCFGDHFSGSLHCPKMHNPACNPSAYTLPATHNNPTFDRRACSLQAFGHDAFPGNRRRSRTTTTADRRTPKAEARQPVYSEYQLRRWDGSVRHMLYQGSPLTNEKNENTGYVGSLIDITELKKTEQALKESHERFDLAQRGSQNGIFDWDIVNDSTFYSARFQEMLGYQHDETPFTRQSWQDYLHPDDQSITLEKLQQHLLQGKAYNTEYRLRCKSGEYRWFQASGQALWNEQGQAVRMVGSIADINERVRIEQELVAATHKAESANRAKSEFLAKMSHEIRTPMNAVIGMAYLLLQSELTDKQQQHLNTINRSAVWLLGIIDDILNFSKLEAGKLQLEHIEFRLDDIFLNLSQIAAPLINNKPLALHVKIDRQVPNALLGDPLRLEQVLLNLIGNAIKFTETGTVTVQVQLLTLKNNQAGLQFSVTDTGDGIPEEQQSRIFEAFCQADNSTTRNFGGTGLGLSICKQLVEAMGGSIGVDSRPGSGSSFYFMLSLEVSQQPAKTPPPKKLDADKCPAFAQATLLLVEDNRINQEVMVEVLSYHGIAVDVATNGLEAIAMIAEKDYSAVLMDYAMPLMDGLEATRIIHADPRFAALPIIAMTANVLPEDRKRCLACGMNDHIGKPIDWSTFFPTLAQWLKPAGERLPQTFSAAPSDHQATAGKQTLDGGKRTFDWNLQEQVTQIAHEAKQPLSAISCYMQAGLNIINAKNPDLALTAKILYKTQQEALKAGEKLQNLRNLFK